MIGDINRLRQALSLQQLSANEVRDHIKRMSVPCEVDKKDQNALVVQCQSQEVISCTSATL